MAKIAHVWSVNQLLTKLNCPQNRHLQTFYLELCRRLADDNELELPKQQFGPSVMCTHCNSLWSTIDYKIRILRGRSMAKSVKKIVDCMQHKEKRIPKVRLTLAKKAIKKKTNRIALKCPTCLRVTKLPLAKPARQKAQKVEKMEDPVVQRRKKKKTRDKTAGLNIPVEVRKQVEIEPILHKEATVGKDTVKSEVVSGNLVTQKQRLKKLNINRLKDIVSKGVTPPKTKSLRSFLSEL